MASKREGTWRVGAVVATACGLLVQACGSDAKSTPAGAAGAPGGGADAGTAGGGASAGSGGGGGSTDGGAGGMPSTGGAGNLPDASPDASPSDAGTSEAGSLDVSATVSLGGVPSPGVKLIIQGVVYTSDEDGHVLAHGVTTPYDATTVHVDGGVTYVEVLQGLVTRTPTFGAGSLPGQQATVSGQLSGVTFPNGATQRAAVGLVSDGVYLGSAGLGSAAGPGYGPLTVGWIGPVTLDATLYAIAWTTDGFGNPSTYLGFGTKPFTVTNGGAFGMADGSTPLTNLALSPISSHTLSGNITTPGALGIDRKVLRVGGVVGVNVALDQSSASAYSYEAPSGVSVDTTFHVFASDAAGESAHSLVRVEDALSTLDITLLAPPTLVGPSDQAENVDGSTEFTFTTLPNLVYSATFQTPSSANPTEVVVVRTLSNTVHLPDLGILGAELPKGGNFTWSVTVDGPSTTMDELVTGSDYYALHHRRADATSTERTFTTKP
ncbi:MAG TPA: hypothetical protein VHE30_12080 [Polyangiaceae bacterium]|nr:hypothetical protein [Polyangiaceae bacterium]